MIPATSAFVLQLATTLFLPSLTLASTSSVLESVTLPAQWAVAGTPSDYQNITLQVGLPLQNLDRLVAALYAVSTPGDNCYGEHLDRDALNKLVAPSNQAEQAVLSWLEQSGVANVYSDGQHVVFSTTVGNANKMLDTQFLNYVDTSTGVQKLRTTQYSVSKAVAPYVDLITPTTFFGRTVANAAVPAVSRTKKPEVSRRQVAASCATSITPICVRELYSVGNYVAEQSSGSYVGFGSFLNQSAIYSDLATFEQLFDLPLRNFSVELINGGVNDQDLTTAMIGEADLDVQNIVGVTSGNLPIVEFITGGMPPFIPDLTEPTLADNQNEPYLPYYQYLLSRTNAELPQAISNSYGEDEQTVPEAYAKRVCYMIAMLGLRGISVFESSGDLGVGAACQSNDGKKTPEFSPQFPGTCSFLTSVGGAQSVSPEVAWTNGSGGFSNYFPRPAYQQAAVQTYLQNYISPATLAYYQPYFNQSGRGFPDVSAHSLRPDFEVIYNGRQSPSGGTSAASPVVAGIVGLLNDARFRAGLPSLGFLNPWLYSSGYKGLNDITMGGSVGCQGINPQVGAVLPGASVIPYASWNATVGWDPVTGLGTPNFQKLLGMVLELKKGSGRCRYLERGSGYRGGGW